jgi:hypothetical protein
MPRFFKIQNKIVNLDAIAYADFLDSGRAMLVIHGLSQEKQHISLDPEEARRLRAVLEADCVQMPR